MTEKTKPPKEEGARAFNTTFMMLANGRTHSQASEKLHGLQCTLRDEAAARRSSATGKMTIDINVTVDDLGVMTITPDIKVTTPKPRLERTILWLTEGGNATPQDPRQQSFDLRDVNAPGPARDVSDEPKVAREVV